MDIIISGNGGSPQVFLKEHIHSYSEATTSLRPRVVDNVESFSFTVSSAFLSLLAFIIRLFFWIAGSRDLKRPLVYFSFSSSHWMLVLEEDASVFLDPFFYEKWKFWIPETRSDLLKVMTAYGQSQALSPRFLLSSPIFFPLHRITFLSSYYVGNCSVNSIMAVTSDCSSCFLPHLFLVHIS